MNLEKLKESARKFEMKSDWRRAIEVYQKAISEFESGRDPNPDLSIYNRVGDLMVKANDPGAAVQAYERAVDLYSEQGFTNNAIALCGKILRLNPGRISVYLKLAQLHARKNVVIDAKKNLLEYIERMNGLNQLDEAFKALKAFADQFPGNQEIRVMLSELLRAASRNSEARQQLEKLSIDLEAAGDAQGARKTRERLHTIPEADAAPPRPRRGDLVFLDVGVEVSQEPPKAATPAPPPRRATVRTPRPTVRTTPVLAPEVIEDIPEEEPAESLEIETTSLVEGDIAIDPVPVEGGPTDVIRADDALPDPGLEIEHTIHEGGDDQAVSPMAGLEIDRPVDLEAGDLTELRAGLGLEDAGEPEPQPGLEIEYTSMGGDALSLEPEAAAGSSGLDLVQEGSLGAGPDEDLVLLEPETGEPIGGGSLDIEIESEPVFGAGELPGGLESEPVEAELEESDVLYEDPADGGLAVADAAQARTGPPSIEELEDRILEDPDNPDVHRALGEALLAAGEQSRGLEELDLALMGYEGREDWDRALGMVEELIRVDPGTVRYYQKLVELTYRLGDKGRLIVAYLELADALLRAGTMDKAVAVYRRVLEHDPGNERAAGALMMLAPPEPEAPPPPKESRSKKGGRKSERAMPAVKAAPPVEEGDFVDLGALILDEQAMDPRMRVEDEEPTGDEQQDFAEMLSQFKRGIEQNLAAEDYQAHYDLGVAFKEMGLLDEAIAEFQKALRSPEGRLRTSEALGVCFYEKTQFAIAEAILHRAVDGQPGSDDEKVGLLYWLGRALEAQDKVPEAVGYYRRVMAVNINFSDTGERMGRLVPGRKK